MTTLVQQAVRNNAGWCSAVCLTHGGAGEWSDLAWTHALPTPRYYPNAVTLDARAEPVTRLIDQLHATRPDGSWSVKDSFASLALGSAGWRTLFTAQWLSLVDVGPVQGEPSWRQLKEEGPLLAWELGWQRACHEAHGSARLFLPALLAQQDVAIIALGARSEAVSAGVIAYRGDGVVSLSNLFAPLAEGAHAYRRAAQAAAAIFPGLPIVSYASGEALRAALDQGFNRLGPLQVWVREREDRSSAAHDGDPPPRIC